MRRPQPTTTTTTTTREVGGAYTLLTPTSSEEDGAGGTAGARGMGRAELEAFCATRALFGADVGVDAAEARPSRVESSRVESGTPCRRSGGRRR